MLIHIYRNTMNETFVIKYKPKLIKDMILTDTIKNQFLSYIVKKSIPHILLYGRPGIGKTCSSIMLADELNADLLFVKASITSGIDNIRNKIAEFANTLSMDNKLKIVILDEADGLSSQAQEALRNLIDASQDDTRFIFTCNYIHKIITPLKSRCQLMDLTYDIKQLALFIKKILDTEGVNYTHEAFSSLIKTISQKIYPDIRASINYTESCVIDGQLVIKSYSSADRLTEFAIKIYSMLENGDGLYNIRKFLISSQDEFGQLWEELAGTLFSYIADEKSEHLEDEVVGKCLRVIANFIVRINRVEINKEVQFAAMLLELKSIL